MLQESEIKFWWLIMRKENFIRPWYMFLQENHWIISVLFMFSPPSMKSALPVKVNIVALGAQLLQLAFVVCGYVLKLSLFPNTFMCYVYVMHTNLASHELRSPLIHAAKIIASLKILFRFWTPVHFSSLLG